MSQIILKAAKHTGSTTEDGPMLQALLYDLPDGGGHVFALYELGGRGAAREEIAITINDHIDRFRQTTNKNMNIARRFEQMLQALNDRLAELSRDFQRLPLSYLNCVVGVITEEQLYISGLGHLLAQYMHRVNKTRFTIYDLDKQFEPVESTSWDKVFVTVLDGELHPGDIFYLATPINTRELTTSELQEILATLPPAGAIKRISQHAGANQAYASICVKIEDSSIYNTPVKMNPISSLAQLDQTKHDTAKVLGEQKTDLVSSLHRTFDPIISKLYQPGRRDSGALFKQALRLLLKLLLGVITVLVSAWQIIKPIVRSLWQKITSEKTKSTLRNGFTKSKDLVMNIKTNSRANKIKAGGVILAAVLAIVLIRGVIVHGQNKAQLANFDKLQESVIAKRDQASARLIFNDRDTARSLLTEAVNIIDTMPNLRSLQQKKVDLKQSVVTVLNTVRGVTVPEIQNLASIPTPAIAAASTADSILVLTNNNQILRYNSVNKNFDTVANTQSGLGNISTLTSEGTRSLVLDNNGQLGEAISGSQSLNTVTSGTNRLQDIKDLLLYNSNLYVLTPGLQQIFKLRAQGAGFDAGTAWIVARDTDLGAARDLTVDGDVYVLSPGFATKFSSGRQTTFNLNTVEPALHDATQIYTAAEAKYLYVLEPAEKRLLVFKKDGTFIMQYIKDEFAGAKSMLVNESTKTANIVTDSTLYSFPLTHLLQ